MKNAILPTAIFGLLLVSIPLNAQDTNGWRMDVGVGFLYGDDGILPAVQLGAFHELIAMPRPEFYDGGVRLAWKGDVSSGGLSAAVGVRHKMYFSPSSQGNQEVLVSSSWTPKGPVAGLEGRFGVDWAFDASRGPYPSGSIGVCVPWELGWRLGNGQFVKTLGLEVVLAAGSGSQ